MRANAKRKKGCFARLILPLLGLFCALALAALFYGMMVYEVDAQTGAGAREDAGGGVLTLREGELTREQTDEQRFGGEVCRVVTREYALDGGGTAWAVSAEPAAYIERLSQEGWTPQLITGYTLAGLDAVFEQRGERLMLLARGGGTIYLIEGELDADALYALGVSATIE